MTQDDTTLHDSDKFQYFAQSMLIGSRAHKFVNSYPQSADDYKAVAVAVALKERFGDKVFLAEM